MILSSYRAHGKEVTMSIIKAPENVKSIEVFTHKISFPVLIYPRDEFEQTQVLYLHKIFHEGKSTTLSICKWCQNHHIHYQVLFPCIIYLLTHPSRLLCYLYLKSQHI